MRKLRKYFHLMVTAVICFFVSLIPEKKVSKEVKKIFTEGQAVFAHTKQNITENKGMGHALNNDGYSVCFSGSDYLKKRFFWMQGPGDQYFLQYPEPFG